MKIRLLTKRDIKLAARIIGTNYSKHDEKLAFSELSDMFKDASIKPSYYVAEDNAQVVGVAGFVQSLIDYSIYQIFWVNVAPEKQRQGIGKMLISKIISKVKQKKANLILLTADMTKQNQKYYERQFGFKIIGLYDNKKYSLMALSLENNTLLD